MRRPLHSAKKPLGCQGGSIWGSISHLCGPTPSVLPTERSDARTVAFLEVHGERMIRRTFDPGFRIELHHKDLNHALTSARQTRVSLPNRATAQELFNACAAHGGAA